MSDDLCKTCGKPKSQTRSGYVPPTDEHVCYQWDVETQCKKYHEMLVKLCNDATPDDGKALQTVSTMVCFRCLKLILCLE